MVAGETILKIIDYPFSYSIVAIIFVSFGFDITSDKILLLGVAGSFGTFLSIVDPLGAFIRYRLKNHSLITRRNVNYPTTGSFINGRDSILRSRAINFEIDQIISIVYFGITSMGFLVAIVLSPYLADSLISHNNLKELGCDSGCIKNITSYGSLIIFVALLIVGIKKWFYLTEKIFVAITYQRAISNEFVTTNSLENMTRSLEQNDWVSAHNWGEKIEDEIKLKKSKRDLIIKSADIIFSPLHSEGLAIKNQILQFNISRKFTTLSIENWMNIVKNSQNVMIVDTEIRQKIHDFYSKIFEYNNLLPIVIEELSSTVNSIFSSRFHKKLSEIMVNVNNNTNQYQFPIFDCAIFDVHPTTLSENSIVRGISAQATEPNQNKHGEGFDFSNPTEFEELWVDIQNKFKNSVNFKKLNENIHYIEDEIPKLQKIYSEMIEWQWKL